MDAQEAVLRAQIPEHVHEWAVRPERHPDSTREVCACGATRWESYIFREHPFGVVIPEDSKDQT